MSTEQSYRIKVLEKAIAILDLFADTSGELTLTQIGQRLGMSKPTAFRILSVLEGADYLERVPETQGYRLGFQLYRLGSLVEHTTRLQRAARPFLQVLVDECQETAHLTVLNKGQALYLDKIEGQHAVRVVSRIGMRLPAHCSGVGKVLLAHLSDEEVDAVVREHGLPARTPNTLTDRAALAAELARIRERGYAMDNEEIELGLRCVAAPVRDATGRVIAAVSVSGPKFRIDGAEVERLAGRVLVTARRISAALADDEATGQTKRDLHAKPIRTIRGKRAARG